MSITRRVGCCVVVLALSVVLGTGSTAASESPGPTVSDPTQRPVVVTVRDDGFDWVDAGVGAAAMLAAVLLVVGLAIALRPEPPTSAIPRAPSWAQKEES